MAENSLFNIQETAVSRRLVMAGVPGDKPGHNVAEKKRSLFPLCKGAGCRWYGEAKSPNSRKCFYGDPQCWKGWVDLARSALIGRLR